MNDYSAIKKELEELIKDGEKLYEALSAQGKAGSRDLQYFLIHYEPWYTKSCATIKQLSPDRFADFTVLYSNPRRKELDVSTYCISDALRTITNHSSYGSWTAALCVMRQTMMLRACLERFDSKLYDIQTILQADLFDSEIDSAKHLVKKGFFRAAGAIHGGLLQGNVKDFLQLLICF